MTRRRSVLPSPSSSVPEKDNGNGCSEGNDHDGHGNSPLSIGLTTVVPYQRRSPRHSSSAGFGRFNTKSVSLQPKTALLTLTSAPPGLELAFDGESAPTPFSRTVIVGGSHTLGTPSPQDVGLVPYRFWSWSDGGAQSHAIVAPDAPATWGATFKANADLSVAESASKSLVSVGDELMYTIVVSNRGPGEQTSVNLVDTLPAGAAFVAATPADAACVQTAGVVTCGLGFLAASASRTVEIVVRATGLDALTNSVRVGGGEPDPNSDDDTSAIVTPVDPRPTVSIDDASVTEGNSGVVYAVFTVSLSVASSQVVTVRYATAGGSATPGRDFLASSGTLVFAPGIRAKAIRVPVIGDRLKESNETFTVNLSGAVNASLAGSRGRGTILDDDQRR